MIAWVVGMLGVVVDSSGFVPLADADPLCCIALLLRLGQLRSVDSSSSAVSLLVVVHASFWFYQGLALSLGFDYSLFRRSCIIFSADWILCDGPGGCWRLEILDVTGSAGMVEGWWVADPSSLTGGVCVKSLGGDVLSFRDIFVGI
ncbi:unnamed protein product [Microthlaspi erraticum]|uniref:Secreted protein n=1 Tax=Microthlaspi erraticum TaxID=1685480 RepID=A0A6D2K1L4_9BRAS|nr:unnamed protein product [Microthlaspi erraticum]CAA7047149.1 unnamed protein product [Microthlaspi erraticum]